MIYGPQKNYTFQCENILEEIRLYNRKGFPLSFQTYGDLLKVRATPTLEKKKSYNS